MRDNVCAAARLQLRGLGVRVESRPAGKRAKGPGRARSGKKKEDDAFGNSPSGSESLVPRFVLEACRHLKDHLDTEGIFRKPGSSSRMRELKARLERGEACLAGAATNDVAGLLKQHLREATEPLVPRELHSPLRRAQQLSTAEERTRATLLLCLLMPRAAAHTLRYLMGFLHAVADRAAENKMTAMNLAVVFTPTLMHGGRGAAPAPGAQQLLQLQVLTVQTLIANAPRIGQWPDQEEEEEVAENDDGAAGAPVGSKGGEEGTPSSSGPGDQHSRKMNRRRSFNDVVYGALNRLKISRTPVGTPKEEARRGQDSPLTGRLKRKSSDLSPDRGSPGKKRRGDGSDAEEEVWDSTPRGRLDSSRPSAGDSARRATGGSGTPSFATDGAAGPPGEAATPHGAEGPGKRARPLLGLSAPHPSRASARLRLRMTKPRSGAGAGAILSSTSSSSSSGSSDGPRKSLRVILSHLKTFGSEERGACHPLKSSAEVGRRLANQPRADGGMDTLRIFPKTPRGKPAIGRKPPAEAGHAGPAARSGAWQGPAPAGGGTANTSEISHRGPPPAVSTALDTNLTPDPRSDGVAWPGTDSLPRDERAASTVVRIKEAFSESGKTLRAMAFARAGGELRDSEPQMSGESETVFEEGALGGPRSRAVPADGGLGPAASTGRAGFHGDLNKGRGANAIGRGDYERRGGVPGSFPREVSWKRLPAPGCSNAAGSAITPSRGCRSRDLKGQKNLISTPREIPELDTLPGYKRGGGSVRAGGRLIPARRPEASERGPASRARPPARGISHETLLSEPDWCWDGDAIGASARAGSRPAAGSTADALPRSSSAEAFAFRLEGPASRLVKASSAEACASRFDDETAHARAPPRMIVTSFVGVPAKASAGSEDPVPSSEPLYPRAADIQTSTTVENGAAETGAGGAGDEPALAAASGRGLRGSPGGRGRGGTSSRRNTPLRRSVSAASKPPATRGDPRLGSASPGGRVLKSVSFNGKGSQAKAGTRGRVAWTGRPLQVPARCPVAPMPLAPGKAAWDV